MRNLLLLVLLVCVSALTGAEVPRGKFQNPINGGADPWLVFHDGNYYLTTTQGDAIRMWKAPTLAGLNADDPRAQRSARVDLARHLVERMRGFVIEGDGYTSGGIQPCLFPGDLAPIW